MAELAIEVRGLRKSFDRKEAVAGVAISIDILTTSPRTGSGTTETAPRTNRVRARG